LKWKARCRGVRGRHSGQRKLRGGSAEAVEKLPAVQPYLSAPFSMNSRMMYRWVEDLKEPAPVAGQRDRSCVRAGAARRGRCATLLRNDEAGRQARQAAL
jgi:hypothetical protein